MKNVQKIIESKGYKVDGTTPEFHIKVDGGGTFMDLHIEGIGLSPDGRQLISVAHYGEQNGDLMRDPDVVFLVDPRFVGLMHGYKDGWFPVESRMDYVGFNMVAMKWNEAGQLLQSKRAMKDIKTFASQWNKNIQMQGFVGRSRDVDGINEGLW